MTPEETAVLAAARAYREAVAAWKAAHDAWTDPERVRATHTIATTHLELLADAALALPDAPQWTTTPPDADGIYWVRFNGGTPYLTSFWREGEHECMSPLNPPYQPFGTERDASGLVWWPIPVTPPLVPGEEETPTAP